MTKGHIYISITISNFTVICGDIMVWVSSVLGGQMERQTNVVITSRVKNDKC